MIDRIQEHHFDIDSMTARDRDIIEVYAQLKSSRRSTLRDSALELARDGIIFESAGQIFVLDDDAGNAACVAEYHNFHHGEPNTSHLNRIVVDAEKRRGGGFGKAMMQFLIEQTLRDGNTTLTLNAADDAISFYDKLGFTRVIPEPKYRINPMSINVTLGNSPTN